MIWTSGAEGRPHSRDQIMTTATAAATGFQVGQTYYGSLACAHSSFPVTCVKRTEKSVWFEHVNMPQHYAAGRCKAQKFDDGTEAAMFRGWYISSTKLTGGDFDPMTI